ncbi:putative isomerase YbhE [Fistulina hepatica ATCC 64428]|uniref:Putative isomerase YbhE n=1 Tax=Fistulina hepatica ATCC 64428 TaxID=1128425 RepID=A0A0D7A4Y5_9AGAR|nr:putative isomerase YbhE [Fistulina hepatica ATCC 64428]
MSSYILVASYTDEVTTLKWTPDTGSLEVSSAVKTGERPSWLLPSTHDNTIVYAALEQGDGKIAAIKYDKDARGRVVATLPSGGSAPCALDAIPGELFIANYLSGCVAILPTSASAPYLLKEPYLVHFTGTGPNKERQEGSHAHQPLYISERDELLVADLGVDRVWRLKRTAENGRWAIHGSFVYPSGSGPRHMALYGGHLYTLLELSSSLSKVPYPPPTDGEPKIVVVDTMSNPPPKPTDMLAAEILIPPPNDTFKTPYIYVSNRNDPSPEGDIISIFTPDLELVTEVRSGLKHLRGMAFGGPDNKWLVAGGQFSGGVKMFERVDGGKDLKVVGAVEVELSTNFVWL